MILISINYFSKSSRFKKIYAKPIEAIILLKNNFSCLVDNSKKYDMLKYFD